MLDPVAFEGVITHLLHHVYTSTLHRTPNKKIDVIVGLDARGFLFGPILASRKLQVCTAASIQAVSFYASRGFKSQQRDITALEGKETRAKRKLICHLSVTGLGAAFVPVRKPGKLPGNCVTATYEKEYGKDEFQMQQGSIKPGQTVLVVDDLIATGAFKRHLVVKDNET